jgi:hypothetical protein
MPNWCSTEVRISGDTKEVNELYKIMNELQNAAKPTVQNGFGTTWLGCLVEALGESWENVPCRGSWEGLNLNDNEIGFYTETAWSPTTGVFDLIRQKFPSLDVYYYAEESGCGIFETNDASGIYFSDRYILQYNVADDYETEYFQTLDEALKFIGTITGREVKTEDEVAAIGEQISEQNIDNYLYLTPVEIVNY